MTTLYDTNAPKRATNLSLNSDLLQKVKSYKINLSQSVETHLITLLKEYEAKEWQEANRDAIEEYNRKIEKRGTFSDGLRRF